MRIGAGDEMRGRLRTDAHAIDGISSRRGDADLEVEERRGLQPRVAHVVGVADPRDGATGDRAAMLDVRVDVREDLAGVVLVGETVDHRDARVCGEALDDRLLERADHHDVDHPRDHARDVLDRLAARELRVAAVQVDRDAAQLVHPRLERDPRARRCLLEHHRERAVAQRLVDLVALEPLLDPARAREQVIELLLREIAKLEEVPGWGGEHGGEPDAAVGSGGILSNQHISTMATCGGPEHRLTRVKDAGAGEDYPRGITRGQTTPHDCPTIDDRMHRTSCRDA